MTSEDGVGEKDTVVCSKCEEEFDKLESLGNHIRAEHSKKLVLEAEDFEGDIEGIDSHGLVGIGNSYDYALSKKEINALHEATIDQK